MIGRTVSHYRIDSQLGAGGMGVVYRAEDIRLGRPVALKFLSEHLAHDEDAVRRLRAEARAASALNHGNICTIYDIDEVDGHPFIVMELLKGRSLRDCLANGPLRVHQLVDIGIEIADALQAAHAEGIVHRDITPANIFITDRGHVKILDFGLAKLAALAGDAETTVDPAHRTTKGITLGTVAYMSPEQATGEELDGRTDLFSVGVILYECATGRHPFAGKTSPVILEAILNRAPVAATALNPDLPVHLQEVINNCLEKDRELRYQSAADLRADLKRVRRDLESGQSRVIGTVSPSSASTPLRTRTPSGGTPVAIADRESGGMATAAPAGRGVPIAAAAMVIVLIAVGGYALRSGRMDQTSGAARRASDPTVDNRLAMATASLQARNYRAAMAYASEVLAIDPSREAAAKVRDEAGAMLSRFDSAIADARRQAASGDLTGAAQALDAARAIDPGSPQIAEVAATLTPRAGDRDVVGLAGQRRTSSQPTPGDRAANPRTTNQPAPDSGGADRRPAEPGPREPHAAEQRAAEERRQPPPSVPPASPLPPPPATTVDAGTGSPNASPAAAAPAASAPGTAAASPAPEAPPAAAATPSQPRVPPPAPTPASAAAARPTADDDEAAIRRLAANYARAIETKDLALFRTIKPNLSREEERRLQDGFRAVSSQRVALTIAGIERRGDEAAVRLKRVDTIQAGGRTQTVPSDQTLQLARTSGGWVIVAIR